ITYPKSISKMALSSDCIQYPEILTVSDIAYLYIKESMINALEFKKYMQLLGLEQYRATNVSDISTGTVQKLRIAVALSSIHSFLLLDEPINGLVESRADNVMNDVLEDNRPMLIVDHDNRYKTHLPIELHTEFGICSLKT